MIGVVTSDQTGTYLRIATDMAKVLDNPTTGMRVLPISGDGSIQNITDLLYLKGVDLAVVQSDVLAYIKDRRIHGGVGDRVGYITRLYNEEFHLVARDRITSIADLSGKRVNLIRAAAAISPRRWSSRGSASMSRPRLSTMRRLSTS